MNEKKALIDVNDRIEYRFVLYLNLLHSFYRLNAVRKCFIALFLQKWIFSVLSFQVRFRALSLSLPGEMNARFTPIDRNGKAHAYGAVAKRHREKRGDSSNVKVENSTQSKRPDWPMCACGAMYVCVCEHSSAVRYNAL